MTSVAYGIAFPASRGVLGGLPWTPADLFANSETGDWWDASDLTTLFQDSAGTTPAALNGDVVGNWTGKINSNVLVQATSSKKPTIGALAGTIVWDGVDDYLSGIYTQSGTFTRISLLKQISATGSRYIFDDPEGDTSVALVSANAGSPPLWMRAGSAIASNSGLAVGSFGVVIEIWNGASSKFIINNGTAVTHNMGTVSRTGLTVGAQGLSNNLAANFALGGIIEVSRVLTDAEISNVRDLFARQGGITL